MSGRLLSEKRPARQVQPPSARNGCASLNPGAPASCPGALVSRAAAQAILHECLAVSALQSLGLGVRVAGLHFFLLAVARRGSRGLVGQAALHERLAVGTLQCLGLRVRVAALHLLLLAVLMRSLGDGLTGHNRERRTYRHQPCRASHTDSFREQMKKTLYRNPNAGGSSMSG